MIPRRFAFLIPVVALAGCAAGSTLRVAEGEESGTNQPVSLAPAPETEPQTAAPTSNDPPPEVAWAPDTAGTPAQGYAPSEDAAAPQGYAPYGNVRTLEIRRIGQWTRTGIGEARRLVIKDANAWAQFWSELGVGGQPSVDFTQNVVVAAAAGQRPTGGHEITIDRVTQAGGELTVEIVERSPGPNCMTAASLTQPVDVVIVPAAGVQGWSFLERKEIRGCR